MKILIIEDNPILSKNMMKFFDLKGFKSEISSSAEFALNKISTENYTLILLDLNLPGMDGLEFLGKIRQNSNIPIIILTSRATNEDMIKGLNIGADDYISKPFDYEVLLARIQAVLRKNALNKNEIIKIGDLEIDLIKRKIINKKKEIILSSLEFDLLNFMIRNRGKILTRNEIYENVWGEFDNYMFSRVVDIYIGYLRKKIGKDVIKTKIGTGYYIN
ncbi:MAG: response regulator transcription factor [Candidatus Gracilibacteria bacterium]